VGARVLPEVPEQASRVHQSILEREKLQELLWQKKSIRYIAEVLKRSPSSISRELRRNYPQEQKRYTPRLAHEKALTKRTQRGREGRLKNDTIRDYVISHLKLGWSPEQIAGMVKKEKLGSISHEAIYQYIYHQIHRDGYGYVKPNKEDLRPYLRRKQKRRTHHGLRKTTKLERFSGKSIDMRPHLAEKRRRLGDWEGDTVESCDHKPGINTIVDRKSGYVLITKVKDKTSSSTVEAMRRLTLFPCHTVTLDNGPENSNWEDMEDLTCASIYYAHPYHSWERGTNENTNGLIREYFPKGTDFTKISDEEIQKVEYILNTRPRKRLNWSTPLEVMSVALHC
jgi:IS30 family transposase